MTGRCSIGDSLSRQHGATTPLTHAVLAQHQADHTGSASSNPTEPARVPAPVIEPAPARRAVRDLVGAYEDLEGRRRLSSHLRHHHLHAAHMSASVPPSAAPAAPLPISPSTPHGPAATAAIHMNAPSVPSVSSAPAAPLRNAIGVVPPLPPPLLLPQPKPQSVPTSSSQLLAAPCALTTYAGGPAGFHQKRPRPILRHSATAPAATPAGAVASSSSPSAAAYTSASVVSSTSAVTSAGSPAAASAFPSAVTSAGSPAAAAAFCSPGRSLHARVHRLVPLRPGCPPHRARRPPSFRAATAAAAAVAPLSTTPGGTAPSSSTLAAASPPGPSLCSCRRRHLSLVHRRLRSPSSPAPAPLPPLPSTRCSIWCR